MAAQIPAFKRSRVSATGASSGSLFHNLMPDREEFLVCIGSAVGDPVSVLVEYSILEIQRLKELNFKFVNIVASKRINPYPPNNFFVLFMSVAYIQVRFRLDFTTTQVPA